ncbi:lipopolysaccharide biosynthesis protein [Croceicoccus sp. Ery15]|uniref:lipopolysaccharide biosynthesis protein n=1 Tax=Croceicoccus sp. Ery15 TaxID=1703338 RepID=UPI001E2933F2|nr:lipopolysaccharide biosynthesis protein [Croceicoccus sp. Ery15]
MKGMHDRSRIARAGLWSALDLIVRSIGQLTFSIVMARLLGPDQFGIIAIATFFATLCCAFTQGGITTALIQNPRTDRADESALYWLNLALAILLAIALAALGGPISLFFRQPVLSMLIPAIALVIIITALGSVPIAILSRKLDYRAIFFSGTIATVSSGLLGSALAVWGAGAWSLAAMLLANACISTVISWVQANWLPSFRLAGAKPGPLLRSALWIGGAGALEAFYARGSAPLLGKFFDVRTVGLFDRGLSMQTLVNSVLSGLVGRISLPVLSGIEDARDMKKATASALSLMTLFAFPAMTGLIITAPQVIEVAFGQEWMGAAPVLQITALAGLLYPFSMVNLQVLLARGESRRYFQIEFQKKTIGICLIIAFSFFGLTALAWSMVLSATVAVFLNSQYSKDTIDYPIYKQFWDQRQLAIPTLAMAGAIFVISEWSTLPVYLTLMIEAVIAAVIYFGIGRLMNARHFNLLIDSGFALFRQRIGTVTTDRPDESRA